MYTTFKTTKIILLYLAVIFTLCILFWSCTAQRGCPGAGRENGYTGYDAGSYHAVKGSARKSY